METNLQHRSSLPEGFIEELVACVREAIPERSRFRDLEGTATYFGTSVRQVRHWRTLGAPAVIVGKRLWFDTSELEDWLATR